MIDIRPTAIAFHLGPLPVYWYGIAYAVGLALSYLVLVRQARREEDIDAAELPAEASWIAARLAEPGTGMGAADVESVLREHREYRRLPPPDRLEPPSGV